MCANCFVLFLHFQLQIKWSSYISIRCLRIHHNLNSPATAEFPEDTGEQNVPAYSTRRSVANLVAIIPPIDNPKAPNRVIALSSNHRQHVGIIVPSLRRTYKISSTSGFHGRKILEHRLHNHDDAKHTQAFLTSAGVPV